MKFSGWLLGKAEASPSPVISTPTAPRAENINSTLADTLRLTQKNYAPTPVLARVIRLTNIIRDLLPRLDQLDPQNADACAVVAAATDYLSQSLDEYFARPQDWANTRPIINGKTALLLLIDQLDLLAATAVKMSAAANCNDMPAFFDYGRLLDKRFNRVRELAIAEISDTEDKSDASAPDHVTSALPETTDPTQPSSSHQTSESEPELEYWVAEVWVDPEWYATQETSELIPPLGPPRIIELPKQKVLIGRTSQQRNISPEIDCNLDGGVSRAQAELIINKSGYQIADLGSSNGTFVGRVDAPLPESPIEAPWQLDADERIYVGAWTRIVVRPAIDGELA